MEGYICINGNKTLPDPRTDQGTGLLREACAQVQAWLLCVTPCGTALFLNASSSAT